MAYQSEIINYKQLRKKGYYSYARMIAMNTLNTVELVEYFVKVVEFQNQDRDFKLIDHGDFSIQVLCDDKVIMDKTYKEYEEYFQSSPDDFLEGLRNSVLG